jgi:predicted DNA-binding transcriptional regulator AlpA
LGSSTPASTVGTLPLASALFATNFLCDASMTDDKLKLTRAEIARAFDCDFAAQFPPILSPSQLSELLGLSVKTLYQWMKGGRLDGTFRKRGKRILIWRDRAIDRIFNGTTWIQMDESEQ